MNCKRLADLSCEVVGRYAHRHKTSDLGDLPMNLIEELLTHIGPSTLLLLELELKQKGLDIYTDQIWREFMRLRWPYKYQRTPDIFQHDLGRDKSPRETYLELHFKSILRKLYAQDEAEGLVSQRFPWIHLTPISALREARRNVKFQTNAFVPPNPIADFDIYFYASHISTMVISGLQLPFLARDSKLLQILSTNVKELHVHLADDKHYALLRYLIVTLQYRGVLENVVLFNSKLCFRDFSELMCIMAGLAKTVVDQVLDGITKWQDSNAFTGEVSKTLVSLDSEMKHCNPPDSSKGSAGCDTDKEEDGLYDQLYGSKTSGSCSTTASTHTDRKIHTDASANGDKCSNTVASNVLSSSEEDMLYDSIYTSKLSTCYWLTHGPSDVFQIYSFNIYLELSDENIQRDFSQYGLKGLGLMSDKNYNGFVEGVLEICLRNWPRLQKLALSDINLTDPHTILVDLMKTNDMESVIVQNLHEHTTRFDPHAMLRAIMHCKERKRPLELLRLSDLKCPVQQPTWELPGNPLPVLPPPSFPGIRELDLSFTEFEKNNDVLNCAGYLLSDKDLRVLHLDGFDFTKDGMLEALKGTSCLEVLTLCRSSGLDMESVSGLLQTIQSLRKLDVTACGIVGSALHLDTTDPEVMENHEANVNQFLASVLDHPSLTDLNLSDNHLVEVGHMLLRRRASSARRLQNLAMRNTSLMDLATVKLAEDLLDCVPKYGKHFYLHRLELSWDENPGKYDLFYDLVKEFILVPSEKRNVTADYVAMM